MIIDVPMKIVGLTYVKRKDWELIVIEIEKEKEVEIQCEKSILLYKVINNDSYSMQLRAMMG